MQLIRRNPFTAKNAATSVENHYVRGLLLRDRWYKREGFRIRSNKRGDLSYIRNREHKIF